MRRQLEQCIQQARTRKQFGQPIGQVPVSLQSDRRHDREAGNEPALGLSLCVGRSREAKTRRSGRRWPNCTCRRASCRTVSMPSAFSALPDYSRDQNQERDLRDSVGGVIFSGTNDIQRNLIAQQLRLG